jgi:hypothetical protein
MREAEPGSVGGVKPSGDRVRLETNVGESDRARGFLVTAAGDQTAPLVSLPVEGCDLYGRSEHGCGFREGYFVLEDLEEARQLLVGVVRVHGDLVDELGK